MFCIDQLDTARKIELPTWSNCRIYVLSPTFPVEDRAQFQVLYRTFGSIFSLLDVWETVRSHTLQFGHVIFFLQCEGPWNLMSMDEVPMCLLQEPTL